METMNSNKLPAVRKTEMRCCQGQEFRAIEGDQGEKIIEGHPAVYNQKTAIGNWFYEIIERGAFDGADMTDVPLLVNHNMKQIPVARSRRNNGNSTMQLSLDEKGIAIRATLDTENNADAKQLYSAVSRGDMDGMSFAFRVDADEWIDMDNPDVDMPTRRIKAISKVFEVSAVIWPAYTDTDISARAGAGVLESAQWALENARAKASLEKEARQSVETENEIELYRMKNRILGGV